MATPQADFEELDGTFGLNLEHLVYYEYTVIMYHLTDTTFYEFKMKITIWQYKKASN